MSRIHGAVSMLAVVLFTAFSAAGENADYIVPDIVYGHKDGLALTFDVLKPEAEPNGAGILFMVSGGWFSRWAPPDLMRGRFKALLDEGYTVFPVRHGSAPRYKVPEAYEDVNRAVRYIKMHAKNWGVNPDRLGVFGGSAGGHLSLMIGLDSDEGDTSARDEILKQDSRVAAVVAYFPPIDLRPISGPDSPYVGRFPALDFDNTLAADVSPILFVSSDDPPTLLIHGDQDDLVPITTSQTIHQAFQDAGVATDFITIEGAGHGFDGEDAKAAEKALVAWFNEHLND